MENHPDTQTQPVLTRTVLGHWHAEPIAKPAIDPELPQLGGVQRAAEVLRYSIRKTEWWLSPHGGLREWLRLSVLAALILGIPMLLIVPIITWLLQQFALWTNLSVQIVTNLASSPAAVLLGVALLTGGALLLRLLPRR